MSVVSLRRIAGVTGLPSNRPSFDSRSRGRGRHQHDVDQARLRHVADGLEVRRPRREAVGSSRSGTGAARAEADVAVLGVGDDEVGRRVSAGADGGELRRRGFSWSWAGPASGEGPLIAANEPCGEPQSGGAASRPPLVRETRTLRQISSRARQVPHQRACAEGPGLGVGAVDDHGLESRPRRGEAMVTRSPILWVKPWPLTSRSSTGANIVPR